jgi:DNA (cytosine-5)-methyltransferase 1
MDKENNELAFVIVDFIDYYRPETGTFENVPGMLDRKNRHYLQELIRRLIEIDYQVRLCLVDASNYQDPQNRKRIVLFIARHDVKLPDAAVLAPSPLPKRTVRDALGDLERIEPVHGSGFVMVNDRRVSDHNVESTDLPGRYEKKRMYGSDSNRSNSISDKASTDWTELVVDSQASTILRQRPVVHYSGRRCLTVRERARLQSFPDDYRFCGTHDARKDQIGNAVPVGLAEAIGLAFMRESYEVYPPDEEQLNGVTY